MPRVVHFEIHAENMERAVKFYTDIFGWEFKKWEGGSLEYWMIMTGSKDQAGIDGGLVKRKEAIDGNSVIAYVCTMDVDKLDNYINKVQQNGGTMALPKMPIPGVGWLCYCKDTEGNIFGMMQSDPSVK